MKHLSRILGLAIVSVLLLSTAAGVATAHAEEIDEPGPQQAAGRIDERLEACLEKLNEWYDIQDENLGKADNAIDRVEELLERAQEHGIDVSEIEAMMPALYAAVGRAEAAHSQAEQILRQHAGFDGSGKVVDRQEALDTCRSAREALSSGKDALLEARDIVQEIIEIAKALRQESLPSSGSLS